MTTVPTTDVYHWAPIHSQECRASQEADVWYLAEIDDQCECEWDFALAYRECPLEADSDGYITIPPYTISSIDDLIDFRCDGHCKVEEAIASAIRDCLPGLVLTDYWDEKAIENIAGGEWSLRDIFTEDHIGKPTDPC